MPLDGIPSLNQHFAAGDCVETRHLVSGNPVHVVPEGTPAPQGPEDQEPPEVLVRLPTFWQLDVRRTSR